jgi:hypothetical protein
MLIDPSRTNPLDEPTANESSKAIAAIAAIAVTGLLLAGYFYIRSRLGHKTPAAAPVVTTSSAPKGPAKVHVLVDDAMLKGSATTLGGSVKNISQENLSGLKVDLELRRRKDGDTEIKSIDVQPDTLSPQQEGRYVVTLSALDYSAGRLVAVRKSDDSLLAYTSGQGQKRPPERIESKTIVVERPAPKGEVFINTPDNPGRVP